MCWLTEMLATWFIVDTKLKWTNDYARDEQVKQEFDLEVLPTLSAANVRELLRAVMPFPHLSPEAAADLVVKHLVDRARSLRSRLETSGQGDPSA